MTDAERAAALESIADEIRTCTRCRLHEQRDRAVPGEGDPDTEVVFVGEGPGRDENRAGRPFVGASGRLLGELIGSIGWRREDVFITNVVKCWPPGNRDPQPDEIAACAPFLRRQLEVLDPAVVVTVGKHSLGSFMPGERIGRVHGTTRPADPATGARQALVLAMYHPAFALYDGSNRATLETDFAGLPATLLAARAQRGESSAADGTAALATTGALADPALASDPPPDGGPTPDDTAALTAAVTADPAVTDLGADAPTGVPVPAPGPAQLPAAAHPGPGDPPDADQLTLF